MFYLEKTKKEKGMIKGKKNDAVFNALFPIVAAVADEGPSTGSGGACAPFPSGECATLRCISWAESRDDDDAVGEAGERSRYQLHPIHADRFAAHGWDFYADSRLEERGRVIAFEVWQASQGWGPWTSAPECRSGGD